MPYVPTNIPVYIAAYAGAISGIAVNGWIVSPVEANYELQTEVAGAFAEAFDTAWADATSLNLLELETIVTVCTAQFSQRATGPANGAQFQLAANWEVSAIACVALVRESVAYFAAQGIVPIGLLGTVIFGVRYVGNNDPGGNGSASSPFSTVTEAFESFTGPELAGPIVVFVGPGDFSGETAIDLPASPSITITGLGGFDYPLDTVLPDIASYAGAHLTIERCEIDNVEIAPEAGNFSGNYFVMTGTMNLNGGSVTLNGGSTKYVVAGEGIYTGAGDIYATTPLQALSDVASTGVMQLSDTNTAPTTTIQCGSLLAQDVLVQADTVVCGAIQLNGGSIRDVQCADGTFIIKNADTVGDYECEAVVATMYGCVFGGIGATVFTFTGAPGDLFLDSISNFTWVSSGSSVVNGTVTVVS